MATDQQDLEGDEIAKYQVDGIDFVAIRASLIELSDRLRDAEERLQGRHVLKHGIAYVKNEYDDAAHEPGLAASTNNRWAQHPLKIEEYR